MTYRRITLGILAWVCILSAGAGPSVSGQTNAIVLLSTGFEAIEGYDARYTLAGQDLWIGEGTGGNGLVGDFFPGQGQQAFIGYFPPATPESFTVLRRPVNYVPPANIPLLVRFTVDMSIVDSTNGAYDEFRWSVYNVDTNRLFTLDFDNNNFLVSYALDDAAGFVSTGLNFTNSVIYSLAIDLSFASNRWSASLNQVPLVSNQPITTTGSALDLGDIDAVWAIAKTNLAGNNYMIFDNYRITAEPVLTLRPELTAVSLLPNNQFLLRLTGAPGASFAIEASADLAQWIPLITNRTAANGTLDFLDTSATNHPWRFYRARLAP